MPGWFFFSSLMAMTAIDDFNPFILHSFDNRGIALVSHSLTGENCNFWKKAMRTTLHGKNKYGFVDGSIPKPALGHSTHALWHRNDSIVSSWPNFKFFTIGSGNSLVSLLVYVDDIIFCSISNLLLDKIHFWLLCLYGK
ncbi:hypothetical protein GmHk_08G021766 [Glycine max]|nr:hypothetical protein GmHk_08G021766 [Glycine max]